MILGVIWWHGRSLVYEQTRDGLVAQHVGDKDPTPITPDLSAAIEAEIQHQRTKKQSRQ